MNRTPTKYWSWSRWHRRLNRAPLTSRERQILCHFAEKCRDGSRSRRWVMNWEIGWSGDESTAMYHAQTLGLCIRAPGHGCYFPTLTRVRRPDSGRLSPSALRLIDLLLGGHRLYHDPKRKQWILKEGVNYWGRTIPSPRVDRLGRLGLLYADGCHSGYREFRYSVRREAIAVVANRTPRMGRCLAEHCELFLREELNLRHELLRFSRGESTAGRVLWASRWGFRRRCDVQDSRGFRRELEIPQPLQPLHDGVYAVTFDRYDRTVRRVAELLPAPRETAGVSR